MRTEDASSWDVPLGREVYESYNCSFESLFEGSVREMGEKNNDAEQGEENKGDFNGRSVPK